MEKGRGAEPPTTRGFLWLHGGQHRQEFLLLARWVRGGRCALGGGLGAHRTSRPYSSHLPPFSFCANKRGMAGGGGGGHKGAPDAAAI